MKPVSILVVLALFFAWITPVAATQGSPPILPYEETVPRGEVVTPDVIGIIAVLSAYALLWGAFAVALKIRALLDDREDGASSDAASGVIAG